MRNRVARKVRIDTRGVSVKVRRYLALQDNQQALMPSVQRSLGSRIDLACTGNSDARTTTLAAVPSVLGKHSTLSNVPFVPEPPRSLQSRGNTQRSATFPVPGPPSWPQLLSFGDTLNQDDKQNRSQNTVHDCVGRILQLLYVSCFKTNLTRTQCRTV
ncbi:hypothetical protein BaRGS_00033931 [Batillaria attramentaria]|uniref:Uncharacterized protein n=1 Tax=Batillaria attramentaria TaxID=370345 RepID=A0ABD0JIV0_9CAEN